MYSFDIGRSGTLDTKKSTVFIPEAKKLVQRDFALNWPNASSLLPVPQTA